MRADGSPVWRDPADPGDPGEAVKGFTCTGNVLYTVTGAACEMRRARWGQNVRFFVGNPLKRQPFSVTMWAFPEESSLHTEAASAPPPDAFGPFRVLHQIGAGALGPVFRAYEPER